MNYYLYTLFNKHLPNEYVYTFSRTKSELVGVCVLFLFNINVTLTHREFKT